MLIGKNEKKAKTFVVATIATICTTTGLIISKYLLGSQPNFIEILVFAIIFWIIFFMVLLFIQKQKIAESSRYS